MRAKLNRQPRRGIKKEKENIIFMKRHRWCAMSNHIFLCIFIGNNFPTRLSVFIHFPRRKCRSFLFCEHTYYYYTSRYEYYVLISFLNSHDSTLKKKNAILAKFPNTRAVFRFSLTIMIIMKPTRIHRFELIFDFTFKI